MSRTWVKIVGSDVQCRWPQKRVDSKPGCTCDHPFHPHHHYEDDLDQRPEQVKVAPVLLEDNGDGTYTSWGYTLWGSVGQIGELAAGVTVVPVTEHDAEHVRCKEDMMARAMRSQTALATVMLQARGREL